MSYTPHKTLLPESELGADRCFQIKYFGHGDILMSTWHGSIDHNPSTQDDVSYGFGMAHGGDVYILASLAGFLVRAGEAKDTIKDIFHEAGRNILQDDAEFLRYYSHLSRNYIARIANGKSAPLFDIPERNLQCLMAPRPSVPGIVEKSGGTGIYTTQNEDETMLLVFARHQPTYSATEHETFVKYTAEFCQSDVPVMARAVCELSLGEYRKDLHAFLHTLNEF